MNVRQEHFTARGLGGILTLALLTDLVVRPFGQGAQSTAQYMCLSAVLVTAITLALTLPLLRLTQRAPSPLFAAQVNLVPSDKGLLGLLCILFALGGGEGVVRVEGFLRYVGAEPLANTAIYALILAAALYAMHCGPKALARASGLVMCLFAFSVVLLAAANAGAMRLENLTVQPFRTSAVFKAAVAGFRFPAELALFFFFAPVSEGRPRYAYRRAMIILCCTYMFLTLTAELVLGAQAQVQSQAIHALSRLGKLSVFRRLDAIHVAIWTLAALAKAAAFAVGLRQAFYGLLSTKLKQTAARWALVALTLGTMVCAALSYIVVETLLTVLTAATLLWMALRGVKRGGICARKEPS